MTIMISIQNGSTTHDVIIEPRNGKGEAVGGYNFSLAPGQKSLFSLWQNQTFFIREAGSYDRGVIVGDSVYRTLDEAVKLVEKLMSIIEDHDDGAIFRDVVANAKAGVDSLLKRYDSGSAE